MQVVLWGGLALFLVVVAYIVQRRMLFFVPNSLSMGFFGATARRQPGQDGAHTNDPPAGCVSSVTSGRCVLHVARMCAYLHHPTAPARLTMLTHV